MIVFNSRVNKDKDDWETPPELFDKVTALYRYTLDAAADKNNTLCKNFLENALVGTWGKHRRVWCNPPFSMKIEFLEKVLEQRNKQDLITVLLPNNSRETAWWNDFVVPFADQIVNLTPRVNFLDQGVPSKGVNFASCLVHFRPRFNCGVYGVPQEIYWDWKWE